MATSREGKSPIEYVLFLFIKLRFPYLLQLCLQPRHSRAGRRDLQVRLGEDSPAEKCGHSASYSGWSAERYRSLLQASLLCSAVRSLQKDMASAISTSFLRQEGGKKRETDGRIKINS